MTAFPGRQLGVPPKDDYQRELRDILNGGIGHQNLGAKSVRFPLSVRVADGVNTGGRNGEIDCELIEDEITVGGTENSLAHNLGRVPRGFFVVAAQEAGILLSGWPDGDSGATGANPTAWTESEIFFTARSSLVGTSSTIRVRILVF